MTWDIGHTKVLRKGHFSHGTPYSFAFKRILRDEVTAEPVGARLFVGDDDEREWHVEPCIGESFPVGDQVWQLESVGESEDRPAAWIRRVS